MKKFCLLLIGYFVIGNAYAAEPEQTRLGEPPPEKSISVELTAQDYQILIFLLNNSGNQCTPKTTDFCKITLLADPLIQKLLTAAKK